MQWTKNYAQGVFSKNVWSEFTALVNLIQCQFNANVPANRKINEEPHLNRSEWDYDFYPDDHKELLGNIGMAAWEPDKVENLCLTAKLFIGSDVKSGDCLVKLIKKFSPLICEKIGQMKYRKQLELCPKRRYVAQKPNGKGPLRFQIAPWEGTAEDYDWLPSCEEVGKIPSVLMKVIDYHKNPPVISKEKVLERSASGKVDAKQIAHISHFYQYGALLLSFHLGLGAIINQKSEKLAEQFADVLLEMDELLRFLSALS